MIMMMMITITIMITTMMMTIIVIVILKSTLAMIPNRLSTPTQKLCQFLITESPWKREADPNV